MPNKFQSLWPDSSHPTTRERSVESPTVNADTRSLFSTWNGSKDTCASYTRGKHCNRICPSSKVAAAIRKGLSIVKFSRSLISVLFNCFTAKITNWFCNSLRTTRTASTAAWIRTQSVPTGCQPWTHTFSSGIFWTIIPSTQPDTVSPGTRTICPKLAVPFARKPYPRWWKRTFTWTRGGATACWIPAVTSRFMVLTASGCWTIFAASIRHWRRRRGFSRKRNHRNSKEVLRRAVANTLIDFD